MGYRVTALFNGDGVGRRAANALEAMVESVAILRRDDWPHVVDDTGRFVSLARLLRAASTDATTNGADRGGLTITVADYFEVASGIARRNAYERYVELNGDAHDAEMRNLESLGQPVSELRLRDAEEIARIRPILFGEAAWREAGRSWSRLFGASVPEPVLAELAARLGANFSRSELNAGVRDGLSALAERRRMERRTRTRRPPSPVAIQPPRGPARGHSR